MTEAQIANIMPPLPKPVDTVELYRRVADVYTAEQMRAYARAAVEAALRDALPQASQPEVRPGVEPVAWVYQNANTDTEYLVWKRGQGGRNWKPLYTTPQASQPLTDEQWNRVSRAALEAFFECSRGSVTSQIDCAAHAAMRATEKAHGIGAAQKGKP